MTTWVVGSGAIGCMVGARLARSNDVVFVDGWAAQVDAINSQGLRVDYFDETVEVHSPAYELAAVDTIPGSPDVVLLSVKSNETESTVRRILPRLTAESCVVSVQNGMNEETIAGIVGADRTIGAMVTGDSALAAPGHAVALMRQRRLVIGELNGADTPRIHALAEMLSTSLPTTWTNNVMGQLWTKLVRNCMFNALGAITGLEADRIARSPVARPIALALGREAIRVASAEGMTLDPALLGVEVEGVLATPGTTEAERAEGEFEEFFGALPSVKSSMLQDVLRGRPTEVDFLNGFIIGKAAAHGIAVPVNERVRALVRRVESGSLVTGVEILARAEGAPKTLDDRAILELLPAAQS